MKTKQELTQDDMNRLLIYLGQLWNLVHNETEEWDDYRQGKKRSYFKEEYDRTVWFIASNTWTLDHAAH